MKVFLVNGCSGAGKSTVAAELAARGLASIDADEDPSLCHWVDADGRFVELPAEPDLAWFDRHRWEWDPVRLDELISAVGRATVFVCGNAANETDLLDRFDLVLLLVIDEPTMLSRIDDPLRDNDFGRAGDERAFLCRFLPRGLPVAGGRDLRSVGAGDEPVVQQLVPCWFPDLVRMAELGVDQCLNRLSQNDPPCATQSGGSGRTQASRHSPPVTAASAVVDAPIRTTPKQSVTNP